MRGLGVIWVGVVVPACFGQVFQGLGFVGTNTHSQARAISADGTTVVGGSLSTPWRWTQSTGIQTFGSAPIGYSFNPATDVSGDGSNIVGYMNDGNLTYAWRWTQPSGVQRVIGVGGGSTDGPYISSDASTIVGTSESISLSGVRWTQATGVQSLGPVTGLPFGNGNAFLGTATSANGSVVTGSGTGIYQVSPQVLSANVPFRWTQSTGSVAVLNNGQFFGLPDGATGTSLSADANVMVGFSSPGIFLWTAATGFQVVITTSVPGATQAQVSGDGTTVVYGQRIWTQATGQLPIDVALTQAGANPAGWSNLIVTDVSFNGRTLCGYGTNPSGQTEAWYATIPAPTTCGVLGFGVVISLMRRRGRG